MVSFTSTTASLGCKVELRMTNENVSAPCAITLGASSTITIAVASTLVCIGDVTSFFVSRLG